MKREAGNSHNLAQAMERWKKRRSETSTRTAIRKTAKIPDMSPLGKKAKLPPNSRPNPEAAFNAEAQKPKNLAATDGSSGPRPGKDRSWPPGGGPPCSRGLPLGRDTFPSGLTLAVQYMDLHARAPQKKIKKEAELSVDRAFSASRGIRMDAPRLATPYLAV